MIVMTV